MFKQKALLVATAGMALVILGYATIAVSAQAPATPPAPDAAATAPANPPVGPGGRGNRLGGPQGVDMQGLMAISACSATDNTDVVAKALGMTASDLRVALVSGKTIQELATAKNISTDTLRAAMTDAQKAQIAQAVKDGVITQAQADFITGLLDRALVPSTAAQPAPQAQGTAQAPDSDGGNNPSTNAPRPRGAFPGGAFGARPGFGAGISPYVTVNNNVVAAKAINISCAALLVAVNQGHQSIAQVAQAHNVTAQTVIDALVKAHTDALNEDVKEGLYTTAEMTGHSANLTAQLTGFVNATRSTPSIVGRFFQFFRGQGGPGSQRGNRGGQPQPGNPGSGAPMMPMMPTAAAS